MIKFKRRFKELRKDYGISTINLGKRLKVSGSTVTRWENGTIVPSIYHLYNIARFFKVSADYLLGLDEY